MAQKTKRPSMIVATSPKGIFVFPKLNEPDYGSRDYPVPNGQYVVRLRVQKSDPKVQAFIAKLEGVLEKVRLAAAEKFAALKVKTRKELEEKNGPGGIKPNKLYSVVYDEETEEETGEIEFKFQMPAKVITKARDGKPSRTLTFEPIIVDARGISIPKSKLPPIWGGTEGIVSFEYQEDGYFVEGSGMYGVKLRMLGVQLITLRSGGERNAASLGFTQQEGLSADDLEERTTNASDEDSTDNEDSGESSNDGDF